MVRKIILYIFICLFKLCVPLKMYTLIDYREKTSRAIVIIDKYVHEETADATLTIFPPNTVNNNKYSIRVLQLSAGTQTCPENRC